MNKGTHLKEKHYTLQVVPLTKTIRQIKRVGAKRLGNLSLTIFGKEKVAKEVYVGEIYVIGK